MTEIEPTAPRRHGIGYIFVGKDGLRAGWSILLFLALVSFFSFVFASLHHPDRTTVGGPDRPTTVIFGEAIGFGFMVLAAFLVSLIERRPFARYGLKRERLLPDLLAGLGWGLVMLSLLVGALMLSGALVIEGLALHGIEAVRYAGLWFVGFLFVGLLEEFLFRGFLQYTLARGVAGIVRAVSPANPRAATIGFWVAAFVFSILLFAAAHLGNGGETVMGIVSVSMAGLTLVYALYRTGSLWWSIGFHTAWDWAQSFLYGVADSGHAAEGHLLATHPAGAPLLSGGTTGPEGSLLVVPTLLLTLYIIHRTLPKRAAAFEA